MECYPTRLHLSFVTEDFVKIIQAFSNSVAKTFKKNLYSWLFGKFPRNANIKPLDFFAGVGWLECM